MRKKYAFGAAVVASLGLASLSAAQSYSSFNATDGIFGVSVTHTGLTYTVSMGASPYMMIGGTHYDITDLFGFWSLSANNPLNAAGVDQHNWGWNEKANNGYIAGWHDPDKKDDIQPGGSLDFKYDALTQGNVEESGFHFRLVQDFQGSNTAYFKGNPVPEPASLSALALGGLALIRRRRRA